MSLVLNCPLDREVYGLTQPFKTVLGHLPTALKQLPGIGLLTA
jgi:hypothetical protein